MVLDCDEQKWGQTLLLTPAKPWSDLPQKIGVCCQYLQTVPTSTLRSTLGRTMLNLESATTDIDLPFDGIEAGSVLAG